MTYERQHRPDDRELANSLDEFGGSDSARGIPGKWTLTERFDQLVAKLRQRAAKAASPGHAQAGQPEPGRRVLVDDTLSSVPKLAFSDFQALALQDVVVRLGQNRGLVGATLGAADPQVAGRVTARTRAGECDLSRPHLASPHDGIPTPQGHAMWGVANARAATLYRRAAATGAVAVESPAVADALAEVGRSCDSLPPEVRQKMEAILGMSLDGVRLHTGAVARAAADAVHAVAFTVGEDIFFPGYDPTSAACQETLAHELVHYKQWRQGRISVAVSGPAVSQLSDALEQGAEQVVPVVANTSRPG